jgi:hypothetical protein
MRRGLPMRREMKEILFVLATDDKEWEHNKSYQRGRLLYKQCRADYDLDTRKRSLGQL